MSTDWRDLLFLLPVILNEPFFIGMKAI